jgi:hypothetical protein
MGLEYSYPCFVFFLERMRVRRYESWPASMSNLNPPGTLDFCVQCRKSVCFINSCLLKL